jgi:preprotein translocase subunit SecY
MGQTKSGLSELKSRLLFVVLGLLIYRLGAHIPVPGLDPQKLANFLVNSKTPYLVCSTCFLVAPYLG